MDEQEEQNSQCEGDIDVVVIQTSSEFNMGSAAIFSYMAHICSPELERLAVLLCYFLCSVLFNGESG